MPGKRHSLRETKDMRDRMIFLLRSGWTRRKICKDVKISENQSYRVLSSIDGKKAIAEFGTITPKATPDEEVQKVEEALLREAKEGSNMQATRLYLRLKGKLDAKDKDTADDSDRIFKGKVKGEIIKLLVNAIEEIGDSDLFLLALLEKVPRNELPATREADPVPREQQTDSDVPGGESKREDVRPEAGSGVVRDGGPLPAGVRDTPVQGDQAAGKGVVRESGLRTVQGSDAGDGEGRPEPESLQGEGS